MASSLSDQQLRARLLQRGVDIGPITPTSRKVYERKLYRLLEADNHTTQSPSRATPSPSRARTRGELCSSASNSSNNRKCDVTHSGTLSVTPASANRTGDSHSHFWAHLNGSRAKPAQTPSLTPRLTHRDGATAHMSPLLCAARDDDGCDSDGSDILGAGEKAALRKTPEPWLSASRAAALIVLLAVAFFLLLFVSYWRLTHSAPHTADTDAVCGTSTVRQSLGCVSEAALERSRALLSAVEKCIDQATPADTCASGNLSLTQLAYAIPYDNVAHLRELSVLIAYNRHWHLNTNIQAAAHSANTHVHVWLTRPRYLCLLSMYVTRTVQTLGCLLLVTGALRLAWYVRSQRLARRRRLYDLVDRIIERVHAHTATRVSDTSDTSATCVAVTHVRDLLIEPRLRDCADTQALWGEALAFIRDKESRIVEKTVLISGEMCPVWKWVSCSGDTLRPSPSGASQPLGRWLEQAFESDEAARLNTPQQARTQCLKIRHLLEASTGARDGAAVSAISAVGARADRCDARTAQDIILTRCAGAPICHVGVDTRSPEGVVYVKCGSCVAALDCYTRLHGYWFDGRLISVKFVALARYHERFPESRDANTALCPSTPIPSSCASSSSS